MDGWYDKRVIEKASKVPDEILLCDEDGVPIDGDETVPIPLEWYMRYHVAEMSIKWKQSIETTINRILMKAIRDKIKRDFPNGVPELEEDK